MGKKEDLKLVFDFIAEYLRDTKEEEVKGVKRKELLIEDKEPKFNPSNLDDVLIKMKKPIDNVGADAAHIKDLMDRVDAKTVEQANINNLLSAQRKEFEQEIKKLKEKVSEELKSEKLNEEVMIMSGDTENSVTEDKSEKVIEVTKMVKTKLGKR